MGSTTDGIMTKAKSILLEAVELDKRNQHDLSVQKYIEGLGYLFEYMNSIPDERKSEKSQIRTKIDSYMSRAESLKSRHTIEIKFLEQIEIKEDAKGFTYEKIFAKCLVDNEKKKLTSITVEDPFIIRAHQISNFVIFCELLVSRCKNLSSISLITSPQTQRDSLQELTLSLKEYGITLKCEYREFHDRTIRFNNGWIVKMGRGLDIWKYNGRYTIGSHTRELRPTKLKQGYIRKVVHNSSDEVPMNSNTSALEKSKKTEHYRQLISYRESLLQEAERIVLEKFPQKVVEFNELLKTKKFIPIEQHGKAKLLNNDDGPEAKRSKNDIVNEKIATGTPVYGFKNGTVPCNAKLAEMIEIVKPLLREAVEDVNKIKIWITLLIPRIEDGNNFGVSIQEECLNEVRNVESEAASFLDQMSRYFISRARILSKIAKYPFLDDYRRSILDLDEKQYLNIRLVMLEMRNHFTSLHDMLTKNYEKVKKPRNSNHENMY
ncbi:proteasome activator pa28 beta subunit domain-containing protein [Ditylenchus destructor]|uniref:Proteasome activator pa28 beta subunit domain-containing protein n=1 Tax=Ditylenchus destructor TaxID=166010 RepID=A0AAD4NE00_9BILA|nr:proteasome activator pa28 beta subunit domain-containing protein [Ditylenchus destructor]